jgi:hypothetical protein
MASLLSDIEILNATGIMGDLFDTFSRPILVYKEPKKIINQVSTNSLPGYGEAAIKTNVTYIPVSGAFEAKVKYNPKQDLELLPELKSRVSKGVVKIRVERPARDFIVNNGKTEKIMIDNKPYNVVTDDTMKRFLTSEYFIFFLEAAS